MLKTQYKRIMHNNNLWRKIKGESEDPSPIHHDSNTTSHITTQDNFQIIGREDHGIARTIKRVDIHKGQQPQSQ